MIPNGQERTKIRDFLFVIDDKVPIDNVKAVCLVIEYPQLFPQTILLAKCVLGDDLNESRTKIGEKNEKGYMLRKCNQCLQRDWKRYKIRLSSEVNVIIVQCWDVMANVRDLFSILM